MKAPLSQRGFFLLVRRRLPRAITLPALGYFSGFPPALRCRSNYGEGKLDQAICQSDERKETDDRKDSGRSGRQRPFDDTVGRAQQKKKRNDGYDRRLADRHSVIDVGMYFRRLLSSREWLSHRNSGLQFEQCGHAYASWFVPFRAASWTIFSLATFVYQTHLRR